MAKTDNAPSVRFDRGLERLMQQKNVSYRALAEKTGLSAGYLNHLVHANRPVPSDDVIKVISKALRVKPDTFLEYRVRRITEALTKNPARADKLYGELVKR